MLRRGALPVVVLLGLAWAVGALAGCRDDAGAQAVEDGPMRVVVSIPPLEGLVRPLVPEDAEVQVLVPPGRSVHGYQLTPDDVRAIGRSDVVVYVGLGLEEKLAWYIDRVGGTRSVVFAEAVGLGEAHAACLDPSHEHLPGAELVDPHLWLDPEMAARFVRTLGGQLGDVRGADSEVRARAEALAQRIESLDAELRDQLAPLRAGVVVTHHASFGRFAERYGLEVAAVIQATGASASSPGDIAAAAEAIETARGSGRPVAVFVEPQLPSGTAERVAERTDVPVGTLDPLGGGDWFDLMRSSASELVRVLGGSGGADTADPGAAAASSP